MSKPLDVDLQTFARALADGAHVIDVRAPFEYESGHVPGAQLVPLETLASWDRDLPRNRTIYVICASGNRSRVAAEALRRVGVDAVSVAGGTSAWQSTHRPIVFGSHAA